MHALMATSAHRRVMLHGLLAARDVVRIVTGDARHLALLKTRRLAQPICAARDLELVVAPRSRRVIEMQEVIGERLARRIGKRRVFVAPDLERQRTARGLEMTLHACLELTIAVEARGIGDGPAASVDIAGLDRLDVRLSRAMAPLAVDPLRKRQREPRTVAGVLHRPARITVVTRHALGIDEAAEIRMRGTIYPGLIAQKPWRSAYQLTGSSIRRPSSLR